MVNIKNLEDKVFELESFFQNLKDYSSSGDISTYGADIDYGKKSIVSMKINISKYKVNKDKKLLKGIYLLFTSITRGIEGFNDYDLDQKFRKTCEGIYQIKEDLEQHIKW